MQLHLVDGVVIAVKDGQLRALELIVDEVSHVGVVAEYAARVGEEKLLIDHPHLGQRLIQIVEHPHAVIFDDASFAFVLIEPLAEGLARELFRLLDRHHEHVGRGELIGSVLLLALLADDEQRSLAAVKALILKRFLDKLRFSALEKAGEQENGDFFHITQCRTTP